MSSKKFMVLSNLIIFITQYYLNMQFVLRIKAMIAYKFKKFKKKLIKQNKKIFVGMNIIKIDLQFFKKLNSYIN